MGHSVLQALDSKTIEQVRKWKEAREEFDRLDEAGDRPDPDDYSYSNDDAVEILWELAEQLGL